MLFFYNRIKDGKVFMNLMYCGDKNIKKGIFLSLASIIKYTKKKLNVYILTASIDNHEAINEDFRVFLEDYIKKENSLSRVHLFDISSEFNGYLPLANMATRFTPFCMLRLFSDKVNEIKGKVLYLDTDVLALSDFSSFYETDIKGYDLAGCADRYGSLVFGNILKRDYFNSGVLLLNMDQIRKDDLFSKCRKMCRDEKMFMPDQSALNKLAIKKRVERCFNEQGRIRKNTVFKHFTTFFRFFPWFKAITIKPWDIDKVHNKLKIHQFDDVLEEYINNKTKIEGE